MKFVSLIATYGILITVLACELSDDTSSDGQPEVCIDDENEPQSSPQFASCDQPQPLQPDETELKGKLSGCSKTQDWCGGSGPEHVFILRPRDDIDVTLSVLPSKSTFTPILRVFAEANDSSSDMWNCESDPPPRLQPICTPLTEDRPWASFFAQHQHRYFIVVDSKSNNPNQDYALTIEYGATKFLETCPAELVIETLTLEAANREGSSSSPTVVRRLRGSQSISRHGTLAAGQGMLHSRCGGSGSEHVYPIQTIDAGYLKIRVIADDRSFEPVLTLRNDCSGNGVIKMPENCESPDINYQSAVEYENYSTRPIYIVVDQRGVSGGGYRLYIDYEPF